MPVLDDLKKPFNLLSTLLALFSLLLSVYFYYESIQKREPNYLVGKSSQIVSKSVTSPKFTVLDSTGSKVIGDVHVLEVSFWNSGRIPIEPSDVRTPVFIEFPTGYRVLEAKIAQENKPAISAFRLIDSDSDSRDKPRFGLAWSHLDPAIGVRFQFIYVGDANPNLKFGGDILDSEIRDASGLLKRLGYAWLEIVMMFVLLIAALFLPENIQFPVEKTITSQWLLAGFKLLKVIAIVLVVLGIGWFLYAAKTPPV